MNQAKKVLLLGWDAADWKIINPLMDQGLMPHLKQVVEQGTIANLATLDPPYSPMLWTSIATGKRPYQHGVLGFVEPAPDGLSVQPVMRTSRKCKALWNILSQQGFKTHVVGWWPSHPAEAINGVMLSEYYQMHKGTVHEPWPMAPGTVYPPSDADQLAGFRVHPAELTAAHLLPFIPLLAQIDQQKDPRVFATAKITAHAASLFAAFTHIIRTREWDFAALYLDAIDHYCHGFMKYHPPKRPHIPQEDFDYYQSVVQMGYLFHDMMLGTLLQLIDQDTLLMLISDHGFQPDHLRPKSIPREPAGPAYEHSHYGILAAMGPGIRRDQITYGASVIDICPTLLAAMGLPIGEDMDGRVLTNLFESPATYRTIPSWETVKGDESWHGTPSEPTESNLSIAAQAMKQLEDLGYIENQDLTRENAVQKVKDECDFNLARAYVDGGLTAEAIPILERLRTENPTTARYAFRLAIAYQAMGRLSDARALIGVLKAQEQYSAAALQIMEANLLIGERQPLKAIQLLKEAESGADLPYSRFHLQLAQCYFQLGRWEEAKRAVEKEIAMDFDIPHAHFYMGNILTKLKDYPGAIASYLYAIGLDFNQPLYHHHLGYALYLEGKYEAAVHALENCLAIMPQNNAARELAMKLYKSHLGDWKKYRDHKAQLADNHEGIIYVVSGLPRSGTSMMMQMLHAGGMDVFADQHRTQDENNPRGYYEHESVKTLPRHKKWLTQARGKVVKVVAPLLPHLPPRYQYKIIYMERDLHEVLASQRKMLQRLGKQTDDALYPMEWMKTYEKQVGEIKKWASSRNNVKILYIAHEFTIKNPFEVALQVVDFLGVDLLPERMASAVDPGLHRETV